MLYKFNTSCEIYYISFLIFAIRCQKSNSSSTKLGWLTNWLYFPSFHLLLFLHSLVHSLLYILIRCSFLILFFLLPFFPCSYYLYFLTQPAPLHFIHLSFPRRCKNRTIWMCKREKCYISLVLQLKFELWS